jgi:Uma2 family endonuclease
VRSQSTLMVDGGWVLPDLMVLEPTARGAYKHTALLAIEVAVSSLRHDQAKAARYALAGVDECWIVDVTARELVVHRGPTATGYRETIRHTDGAVVPTAVDAPAVEVTALLGPIA